MKYEIRPIIAILGIILGIAMIVCGILSYNDAILDTSVYSGEKSPYSSGFASFGADYYTYSVNNTAETASAVKAADTAVNTSDVEIYDLRISRGQGGKGVVIITGQVSDVTAAVESGAKYAESQGLLHGTSVLANPHPEVWEHL